MENKIEKYAFHLLLIIIFGAFVAFTIVILKPSLPMKGDLLALTNVVVVFWTGVFLVIYTYETMKLRETAQKQIELQQRPFVIFEIGGFVSEYGDYRGYRVRNIGVGTAINVHVMDIYPEGVDWCCRFLPYVIPLIMPQEQAFLSPHRMSTERNRMCQEIEDISFRKFSISVQFSNADMTRYFVSQQINSGEMIIHDSGRG